MFIFQKCPIKKAPKLQEIKSLPNLQCITFIVLCCPPVNLFEITFNLPLTIPQLEIGHRSIFYVYSKNDLDSLIKLLENLPKVLSRKSSGKKKQTIAQQY